jgi:hypothetical protein
MWLITGADWVGVWPRRSLTGHNPVVSAWAPRAERLGGPSSSSSEQLSQRARSSQLLLDGFGGGEKVDEQLCDALGLVVMHPVRRAEQTLDAVQVGHIIVVGLS